MIKLEQIYYENKFRASSLTRLIWKDIIEEEVIYFLGLMKKFYLNITLDSVGYTLIIFDSLLFKRKTVEKKIIYNHYFFNNLMTSITIDITFNNHNKYMIVKDQTRFFYSESDNFDPGIVDCSIEVNCSVQSVNEFKKSLLPSLSREVQYSILRNINGISLESENRILNFAEFEYFLLYTEISQKDFIGYINKVVKEKSTKKDIISIYKQIKGIKWTLITC